MALENQNSKGRAKAKHVCTPPGEYRRPSDLVGKTPEPHVSHRRADLRNQDLSGLNLIGADFTEANLQGANLSYADCEGATFHWANLSEAR